MAKNKIKVHPIAELFPMMTDEELEELAQDIAANGLLHPIVLDDEGQLIDGRNRLAACRVAEIEPTFQKLDGHDPVAYIVSANLNRRNLTKGQQAMALAMIYPEPERGRGKKDEVAKKGAESASFSYRRLKEARQILRQSRDLAQSVLKGTLPFDDALARAEESQRQASSTDAKMARLQAMAPDLAARVSDENLSLDEALVIYHEREAEVKRIREAGKVAAERIIGFAAHVSDIHSAIAAGEDLRLAPAAIKTLTDAFQLLLKDMQPEESANANKGAASKVR